MQQNFRKRTFIILLYTLLRCGNINSNVLFQAKVHKKTLQFIEAQWDSNSKLLWHIQYEWRHLENSCPQHATYWKQTGYLLQLQNNQKEFNSANHPASRLKRSWI